MIPEGVAAAQARISAIESRFAPPVRAGAPAQGASARSSGADFDQLLAAARVDAAAVTGAKAPRPMQLERLVTERLAPQPVHHSEEMGPAGAPAELAAYGNGRIPASALTPIGQGNHRLWEPAARSFQQMSEAAAREGITIRVTDSYRSYEAQVSLAERKGLYGQGGLAARPGTSNHGWGRSLDIDTGSGTVEWLRTNAARFGFHEDVGGEPWHWTYRPAT